MRDGTPLALGNPKALMVPYRRADHDSWPVHVHVEVDDNGVDYETTSGYFHEPGNNRAARRAAIRLALDRDARLLLKKRRIRRLYGR